MEKLPIAGLLPEKRTLVVVIAFLGLSSGVVNAAPVSPTAILPSTLAPPPESGSRSFKVPKFGTVDAPSETANEKLLIGSVVLKDGLPQMAQSNQDFVEGLKGKTLTLKKIYEAATALEQAYARAGYIFVRVVVPPQRLRDGGVITFGVVNGFIEKVLADKVPAHYRDMVKARLLPLIDRRSITLPEVERCVLLAGDLPGLKLSSALMRGDKAGGVVLIVEGESTFVGGSVTVDNRLPENLGTFQQVTNVYLNNPTGHGERLYATVGSSLGGDRFSFLTRPTGFQSVGLQVPVGSDGWMINPEFVRSNSLVSATSNTPQTESNYMRSTIRAMAPLIRNRQNSLNATLGVDYISYLSSFPVLKTDDRSDRYAVLRSGVDYSTQVLEQTSFQSRAEFSKGLGGRSAADAVASKIPLSRQGSSPEFSAFKATAVVQQALPASMALKIQATAQTSFGSPLFSSEQLSLEGSNSITGVSTGSLSVDEGFVVRSELSYPLAPSFLWLSPNLEPYVFAAGGAGTLDQATAVERSKLKATSFGIGLRTSVPTSDAAFSIEYAQAHTNLVDPLKRSSHRVSGSIAKGF